jgi:hypothetical protein
MFDRLQLLILRVLPLLAAVSGCAVLHSVELGELESAPTLAPLAVPIEVMVSERGFSIRESVAAARFVGAMGAVAAGSHGGFGLGRELQVVGAIAQMSNFGPTTGNPVFDDRYVDELPAALRQACPSGRVSGLQVTRESAKYPVLSGEIVRIKGQCLP